MCSLPDAFGLNFPTSTVIPAISTVAKISLSSDTGTPAVAHRSRGRCPSPATRRSWASLSRYKAELLHPNLRRTRAQFQQPQVTLNGF